MMHSVYSKLVECLSVMPVSKIRFTLQVKTGGARSLHYDIN